MRIGFDVTSLSVPQSGVGTYTWNLFNQLGRFSGDTVVPLAHRQPNGKMAMIPVHGRSRLASNKTAWMQFVLPLKLARSDLDVCHFTNNVASLWTPLPSIITIHDMTLWLFPEHHYRRRLLAIRPFVPLAARHAKAIITVSHSAKRDIVRVLGVPADKVHVIYEAPASCFRPLPDGGSADDLRRRFPLPEHFILYVGTIEPRKNLVRLLKAFARLYLAREISHHLIFVGQRGWKDNDVFTTVQRLGIEEAVHFTGHVPVDALVALYNLADALVFPSLYEGFGLPVVEAMACGTPVITSSTGSLGEVAGDAAEFVDPAEVTSIAAGIRAVLTSETRRRELRQRGLAHVKRFDWKNTARETRDVYSQVMTA